MSQTVALDPTIRYPRHIAACARSEEKTHISSQTDLLLLMTWHSPVMLVNVHTVVPC